MFNFDVFIFDNMLLVFEKSGSLFVRISWVFFNLVGIDSLFECREI